MNRRRLRARCQAQLAALKLPRPFDINQLCAEVGHRRGRPIALVPIVLPPRAPCGILAATEDCDYIFIQARTSAFHRAVIALHEIAHLLFGHAADAVMSDGTSRLLAPSLDPALVRRMLGRTHYREDAEREAEMLASMILSEISDWVPDGPTGPPLPAEITHLIERLETTLVHSEALY